MRIPRRKSSDAGRPLVRRVLVGTDRSATAHRAVLWAADMAERYDAELLVVQVVVNGAVHEVEPALREYVQEVAGERGRASVVSDDDPARAIVEAVEREDVDVVVVGSVGMSGRKEFLLRNVPNRISHNAPCTVVIVNTTGDAK